ncbi:MAG: EF-P lysine aminoacylase EpmA [Pseudomonadota bacterium]
MTAAWAPRAAPATLALRARMRAAIRSRMAAENVLEFEPTLLCRAPVTDAALQSIAVTLGGGSRRYLHTSPEYQMKRLLAAGGGDCYALAPVFRDAEWGARHQPEFTLLEWYRLGFHEDAIVTDTLEVLAAALAVAGTRPAVRETTYRQAFVDCLGIDPLESDDRRLRRTVRERGGPDGLDRDGCLDALLTIAVTPAFAADTLTVLRRYPATQAALARLAPDDPRTAERFEIFAGELELANGFVELTDAAEQRRRFVADNAKRRDLGLPEQPLDEALLAALAAGLPACAGVAVGFDRLVMVAAGAGSIADVQAFPAITRAV